MPQKYNFEPKNEGLNLFYFINTLVFGLPVGIIGLFAILFGYDFLLTVIIIPALIIVLAGGISYFYYFSRIKGVSELSISDQKLIIKANNESLDIPFAEAKIYLFTSIYFRLNELFFIRYKNNFYFFRPNEELKNFFGKQRNFRNYKTFQVVGEIIFIIVAIILLIHII